MTDVARKVAEKPEGSGDAGLWMRRTLVALLALAGLLGLLDVFGQGTSETAAAGPAATLRVSAPRALRGGLFFQSRVEIRALRAIDHPRLVLDEGWLEGMQFNSAEPAPVSEASRDGRVVFSYDGLAAGDRLVVWMPFEVNPTNVGTRSYGIELDDAEQPLARVRRDITVFP
ncbi:MAG: hypothetical protein QOG35_750 [Solirubrobacteraceae bacterium]|nr:hypothetical protein [Solirubrobacteraceae bacterium]